MKLPMCNITDQNYTHSWTIPNVSNNWKIGSLSINKMLVGNLFLDKFFHLFSLWMMQQV